MVRGEGDAFLGKPPFAGTPGELGALGQCRDRRRLVSRVQHCLQGAEQLVRELLEDPSRLSITCCEADCSSSAWIALWSEVGGVFIAMEHHPTDSGAPQLKQYGCGGTSSV